MKISQSISACLRVVGGRINYGDRQTGGRNAAARFDAGLRGKK